MVDALVDEYRRAIMAYPHQYTIFKENLIVFDPDYFTDYPPNEAVHFAVPQG